MPGAPVVSLSPQSSKRARQRAEATRRASPTKPTVPSANRPEWADSGRIPSLDGLRALSIGCVILSHALGNETRGAWSLGHFGVTSFFVISGFLITLLLIRERSRKGDVSIAGFYKRRALRILPAYLGLMAVIALFELGGVYTIPASSWLRALTYTSCFQLLTMVPVLGHTWSLSVEEHFYLLWPLIFRFARPRTAIVLLAGYIAAVPALRLFAVSENLSWLDPTYSSPSQMASIAVGCLLAFAVSRGNLPSPARLFAAGFVLLAIPALLSGNPIVQVMVSDSLRAFGFGLVMLAVLTMGLSSRLAKVLNWKPVAGIGTLSYSLYLWQQPLTHDPMNQWLGLALLLPIAWLSYRFIERPFLILKDAQRDDARPARGVRVPALSAAH